MAEGLGQGPLRSVVPDAVVSHWDVDGVLSACLLSRALGLNPGDVVLASINASVRILLDLAKKDYGLVALLDLNMPKKELVSGLRKAASLRRRPGLLVVDHHAWDEEAVFLLSAYSSEKVLLVDPTAQSTAKLIADRVLESGSLGEYERLLVDVATDDDTFVNAIEFSAKMRLLLRWYDWGVRYRLLESCVNGVLWPAWAEDLYRKTLPKYNELTAGAVEGAEILRVGHLTVAVMRPSERVHPGDVQLLFERARGAADLYVFLYKGGVSLRSRTVDLTMLLRELGGGGHAQAGGASFGSSAESEPEPSRGFKDRLLGLVRRLYGR